jgi:hypothetical protein
MMIQEASLVVILKSLEITGKGYIDNGAVDFTHQKRESNAYDESCLGRSILKYHKNTYATTSMPVS